MNSPAASASGVRDVAKARKRADRDHLNERHQGGDDDDRHDQRERDRPARVTGFTRGNRNGLIAAIGEDQQQCRSRQLARARRRRVTEKTRLNVEQAHRDEDDQRRQLSDGQHIDHEAALTDAADVDQRDRCDHQRDQNGARCACRERGPVEPQRRRKHVDHRGPAGGPGEPQQPSHFKGRESSERRARIQIRAAGALEPAADFGERHRDHHRRQADGCDHPRAPGSSTGSERCGEREHRGADDLIDTDGREIPSAKFAAK